ncbi:MAG: ATP-dependent DNA helicase RecG [Elusimicrobia bacterium CG1_02_63_36]|nr:MAG: ATP-dependent DNA helicase RecG [Elusimicrobia bacterium CG1_02_63_36]PIP82721.1 MAG: ATP-dependent DNA helicase RecG [Elusimicrobia bacterium CG22_combo_CG10-13_8_21_14_all_63_91]PJA11964.1 MAG: ATP-dependent DNA helicase RecG [Elusimicrobia bacterium CG_4_10_14_0_2_um_filter_63_34]PJB23791.1 MAG: ATP-dependent DNA helicase RecG [Elusimicrobia bacterium CG_4_9_14_3_um_filter_62_55]
MLVNAAFSRALERPVQYLKGVGPKRARLMERLGLRTLRDLIEAFPRTWEDRIETPPGRVPVDAPLVLKGRVTRTLTQRAGTHLELFIAKLQVPGHGAVDAVWFKRPNRRYDVFESLRRELAPGADAWVIGRGEPGLLKIRKISVQEHYLVDDPRTPLHVGKLVPIYPTTAGLPERLLREIVAAALDEVFPELRENLPEKLLRRRELLTLPQAVRGIHRPRSSEELEQARRRLSYEELLLLEFAWTLKHRQTREVVKGYGYEIKRSLLTPFRAQLGFELTRAQKRVVNEILGDMQNPYPMTRLLQGDVGSGKTVVAIAALLLAIENGYQGAFMAPTEILAEQHFWTFQKFLGELPVRVELITSSVPKRKRERILARAASGEVDAVLGTHALLEESVAFKNLRLAIIDEQHRFGVRQRTTLRQKGPPLDLLLMTATPIPRTLSLALYGDLDVSTLDEMPPGRIPAKTLHIGEKEAFEIVRAETGRGLQAYIVYPIIEESASLDLKAAQAEFNRLSKTVFADRRVSLVHGRLPGKKKVAAMEEFASGGSDILVATQVIEVGVDVPNAGVMVIQNADRFGLASLHQLRGRIGRGSGASTCCLVAQPKSPEARRRVAILCETSDGFRIGEEDLKIRGPGEMLGMAQHGELGLRVADLVRDSDLLASAREDARELLAQDPDLKSPDLRPLRDKLVSLYQERWQSIDLA